jgi:hypothetical protein
MGVDDEEIPLFGHSYVLDRQHSSIPDAYCHLGFLPHLMEIMKTTGVADMKCHGPLAKKVLRLPTFKGPVIP